MEFDRNYLNYTGKEELVVQLGEDKQQKYFPREFKL